MGKITSYKDFKNNVQSIRDELTKQGYTPRSVPSEQKEETKNTKKIEKGKGLFKETGKSSFNDIPKIQELQNEYQKAKDWGFYDYTIDQIKKEELPTKFGNVNMNKRPLIRWNDELKKKYENELKSWGYDPEIGGIDTVFGGSDKFGTDINNSGWNVAYTPIMPDGTFLDKGTVDNYMNSLVKEAYKKNGNVTNEELETLDKKGMQVGDKYVHGIFAGVDGDEKDYHKPYSAEDRGKLMHFSGKYGAINIAKRGTDNLKTNPNEEQSDSDEKEEYLNQQVDIPITDNKSISLKYRTVKTIDNFLKRNKEKNKYKKAQQLDEMIDKLDLSENELKNAKSYAGLKKLSLMSSSNGKDSVLKELGQFVAYPIGEMYDFAKRAGRTYVKDGFPFKVQQMGAGDYSEQLQELDKYYSENPDELGNDFFNRKSTGNDAYSDYMDNLRKVKAYEAFDNTNPVTHFIAEKGLGSMGQMLAAYGTAGLMGLPDVTEGVSSAAKKVAGGTKIGQVVSKVANATPDIANVAEKGIGSKIANAAINKANNLSIGSAAKFLNPLDNSTTLLMGIDSAQQKYDDLVKNGYDKDTAYKNAMFTGYVNTITEKMGYDGTPESMMFALSPTGSTKKNVVKVLKQYMKANVGEGLEEVYGTLFERMGDVVSKVGYVDENGKIQQRKLVGKEGVIDLPALGESFLGGAVGGAVMGGAGVVDTILHTDAKSVRECGDEVKRALSKANKEVSQKVLEAGAEMPELPKQINWKKSTVPEMKEYFNKVVKVYRDILSDEKVINYDRKVAENTLNKMNTAETGNEVNEATNINNVNATPQTENSIQNVPKTSEIEPLQAVQETAPLNAQVNDISNINTQNSKINADNSTINDTTSEINSVDTLNAIDTLPNISTQENGVQSSANHVTDSVHNAMKKIGLNVSENATGIQEANTKFMSKNDNLFDRNYVSNYANDFVQAMSEKSGRSYTALSQETDNLADELVNKALTGNSVLDGNREFQTVVRNFKDVLREGIKKNANLHNNVYGANEVLNAQVQDIENGDYSSLNITENPNNNVTFAPITENEQNIGYIIERDNGYSNELSESDFTVKQKNGEYGTRNGITYGHFGTHQNSNGNNIVSYLPTGNAVAILPNQNSAIEFMKQAENETSGYSIYLYDDNGVTKTGGDMLQFISVLNNAKNAVQVEQNPGNVGIQSNTDVSNNVESEKINSQAPNTDENTNTTQTDNAIKSIEISEEDKIPGLLQDEYSDLLSLEDRTALDTLGSAIGVPIKIVPTISNDANGCYYKGVIYISLSADDKVMTVFSHELTHYLEDTLDYTEYKKCVLDFIQKNTDKSIDELAKEKVDTYAKSSINLTYEEATREIVADYTQNILKDADAVMEFVDSIENREQRRGVIRRLLDAIKELINKIKAKFSSKHSQMQDLQKTSDLLEKMLAEASENTENINNKQTKYSYAGVRAETDEDTIDSFGIEKLNDYINVQRSVNNTLLNEGFFSDEGGRSRTITNEDSGMIIQITPKGIKETFGEKNFYNLGRKLKIAKLSVVRDLPSIIQSGKLLADNVENKHNPNSSVKYAYIESNATIDGYPVTISIDIRKSPKKNTFWVHKVDFVKKNNGVPSQDNSLGMGSNYSVNNSIPENNSSVKYSFAGSNAKTANVGALQKAEELEQSGVSAEEIRKVTGWSRGLDNKWKFEIDDSKAKYKEEKIRLGKAVNLNEVLEHEDLFKAYPDLKKVKVKEISNLDARGIYSPNFDCIFINENLPTQEKLKSLIHEVQHAIQVREGFAVGESPDSKNRNQSAGEIEADDVKARQSMSKEERLNTFPESMKPNQNADVVFWESGKGVDNSNNNADIKYSMKKSNDEKIENRLSGDDLLNAYDTIEEIRNVGGRVDENGYAYVYHNTSKDNAENIRKTGVMSAKEDGIFVSTKLDGQSAGYGNETVSLKIPVEKLVLDDMFDDELHFRIPLKNKNDTLNVSNYLIDKSNADNAQIKSIAKNTLNKDNVEYAYRYSDMNNEQKEAYNRAKKGDVKSAYNLIEQFVYQSGIMKNLSNNVYLLPVIGAEGTSDNILPECIAYFISKKNGNQVFYEIVKQKESNSRKLSIWERMKENYPEFDISSDIRYNDIKGKSFLLIDDNSTTGRTFKGLEGFIEDNGGKVVGYYAMTTGQDMSEKMITTDETWEKLKQLGIEKIRNFAESEGIRREISRNGLTERETRELIRQYRKKVDKRRTDSFKPKSEGTRTEIRRVYENGRRNSENGRTRGKFSLKSSNSSNLDTVENNTDNVQIKSENFKNWFGDWENNPSKASKVVNEDGTPKIVYHGTTSNFTTFDTQRFNTRENSGDYVGEGFFFTDKESTAKKYGSSVMPVYLNLRNPLIINTENDGKKFRSTFLNMYQKGDKELRDLIGGDYDYFSIMKENPSAIRQELQRRGYDGLIDNLYGQYAVFNSEQIKSATDNIGTFDKNNADIRYSSQKSKPTTVHSVSKKLISDYGVESKVKPSDISEAIADITSKINDTYYGEGDINKKYAKLEKAAYGVAEKIVDQMKKKDNYAEEIYNNLRKEIKSTKIRISEVDKGDFTEWNDFRKQNFGYLTLSNKEGIPVDSYYKELAQEYPGMFDESTHMVVGDQLRNIVDTLRDLKPKEYDLGTEERDEMLEEVTNEVILRSINLADDMGYIDKNGNADKIYTESDMRGALDKQKERLNNKHEKQLDRQKERLENKYEKRLETQKTKYIEQREKIRKQLIDKVNQQKEKAKARKKESEDRTKLLKLAREINSMKLSPQDKNKLPDILKEIDTVSKGILKKGYTTKDGKAVMGELDLKQLKEDYELLKQDENFLPDKDVELKISRLDKMQIADMNINDVRDLIQTLQEVKHEIRTKDKMINDVRNREIAHTAMESIKEIQRGKGIENKQKGKWYRGYISTQLTPERMFRRLSGYAKNGVFEGLAKDLSDGQRKSMTFKQRASEKFKTVISKTEEMSKFTGKKAELIDISKYDTQGRKVYITPDMRTSLYLHSKNYSNLKHIQYGGITIPNMDLYKQGKIKDAYESAGVIIRLTPSQVNEITSKMTPFEKQFADVAYNFFNDDCSKAINETSIALKGYEIATVRDYFPIVSNRNFINNDFESLVKNGTLEGKGMLKERKYASNPVALESVIRAINRQMSDVADYYGLAIPIRNFNKVYNSMGRNYNYSVKESLKQKWGLNADKYIENLITDLQSGRKTDGTLFDMLKGHYAQGVLSLNLGVTLKQAASYPTAAAVVGYKPLAKAFSERVSDSDRKIIDKYTPLLWYRSQGYTTSEFGDYADGTYEDWTKKGKMPLLMGWIQAMDIATTTKLWKAAEFYVRDNYETLEQGTDEYYKQVADVYNSIIENTQPNYSTMQRPDILRNPNALVKSVTMFKTQVMQNFNILYDAYGEYNARYQDYQSNKTEENAEDLKSAAHNLGKAISSQIIAAIVLNLCDGIGRFLKGKFDDYYGEDDKDKTITLKSAMSAYLTDCFNTVMGTTLGGSETAALVEYILSIFNIGKGAVWYDIQAPALDTINNTVDSLTSLLTTVSKNGASSPWAYVKSINKLLKELGTATGIPLKNGEALLYGIYKNITDWTKKENVFETLDSWTDESKREYTKDDGHKYRANMSIKEYKEYNAYYEKIVKDMQSGKIRKKNGEKYSSNGIKQAARKKANEKFEKLFTEKVE